MIFPASSTNTRPIVPALLAQAQKIEKDYTGLHVLAAREFRYPVQQQELSIRADQFRKMNLLEKFILLASTEVFPRPSLEELADALGLDPIFIKNTFDDLLSMQSITYGEDGFQATEEGRKSLSSEIVTEEPIVETRYLIQDPILRTKTFSRFRLRYISDKIKDLSSYLEQDLTQFPIFDLDASVLQAQLQELVLDLHDPDNNRFVTAITQTTPSEIRWQLIHIFVLYDTLKENYDESITFEARSFENEVIPLVGEWLEEQLQQRNLSLKTLCGLNDDVFVPDEELQGYESVEVLQVEPEVEGRLEEIRQQAITQLRLKKEGQTLEQNTGTSVQLRDMEIRPAFLKALQDSQELIIIYSPWMNEQVVDSEFISLLAKQVQQGVRILIGYGIGRNESREDRPVSANLLSRLQDVQTAEGTPGIIAQWLGNSHAKEVIIDRKVHFSGSHNWLSYRGDRFPRGETVYEVTIATEVEKAYHYLAQRFIEHAESLWVTTDEERRLAICLLCSLGYEQRAIDWIRRDGYIDLVPLWFKQVLQGIAVNREEHLFAPLQTALTFCCMAINPQDSLVPEIATELRKVLERMAQKNQQFTLTLVKDNFSELKQLEFDQYVEELNAIDYRKQDEKKQDFNRSTSVQEATQQWSRHRNRARRKC